MVSDKLYGKMVATIVTATVFPTMVKFQFHKVYTSNGQQEMGPRVYHVVLEITHTKGPS